MSPALAYVCRRGGQLRRLLAQRDELLLPAVTDLALGRIVDACRWDVELAADAVVMLPRPAWVARHIGGP